MKFFLLNYILININSFLLLPVLLLSLQDLGDTITGAIVTIIAFWLAGSSGSLKLAHVVLCIA